MHIRGVDTYPTQHNIQQKLTLKQKQTFHRHIKFHALDILYNTLPKNTLSQTKIQNILIRKGNRNQNKNQNKQTLKEKERVKKNNTNRQEKKCKNTQFIYD